MMNPKNICQVEHLRHRSFEDFIDNLITGLIAYSFFDKNWHQFQPIESN